jgi:alcohol dehydrogenase, propanol-preferring
VANVTSRDVNEFIRIAAEMPFKPEVKLYSFEKTNPAIMEIKHHKIKGAKVAVM